MSEDIRPYTLRKVRILNGAHSALVARTRRTQIKTVREAIEDPEIGEWLNRVLFEEIVPTIDGRCESPEAFARDTLDRFRNPFLNHELSAIALNHEAKWKVRIEPTIREFEEKCGKAPPLLSALG
jgi:tagaturonate reductase